MANIIGTKKYLHIMKTDKNGNMVSHPVKFTQSEHKLIKKAQDNYDKSVYLNKKLK